MCQKRSQSGNRNYLQYIAHDATSTRSRDKSAIRNEIYICRQPLMVDTGNIVDDVDCFSMGKFPVGILPVTKSFRFGSKNRIISSINAIIHNCLLFQPFHQRIYIKHYSSIRFFNSSSISLVRNIKRNHFSRIFLFNVDVCSAYRSSARTEGISNREIP